MNKLNVLILSFLLLCSQLHSQVNIGISNSKRFLINKETGKPFFWLGDTAWELFHRLTREETEKYFKKRTEQGFNVIQAVALAEVDGLNTPNAYGDTPLINIDPSQPNEKYFQHIDWVIKKAAEYNLYIALLPTWGDKIYKDNWGVGPEIFTINNAEGFGKWISNRYKNEKNIIWILGGDRNPRNENDVAIWRKMAAGITQGGGGADKVLMSFHPQPTDVADGGSAKWFHTDDWLDFNMLQTGHCRENNIWDRIKTNYDKQPVKPVLDGETIYEDHPVCFNAKDLGISNAYDVRKNAYLSVFAGSFGHTYGCHDVWQMYAPGRTAINGASIPWYDAINLTGANQMKYLRRLIEARPLEFRVPDQSLITNARYEHDHIQATRGNDYAFIYTSEGKEITVNFGKISGGSIKATWYNPRNGETKDAGVFVNKGKQKFIAPGNGYGQDWVLIIDDAGRNYPKPGE